VLLYSTGALSSFHLKGGNLYHFHYVSSAKSPYHT
jgi:hypothetical protein